MSPTQERSDAEARFSSLFAANAPRIYAYIRTLLPHHSDADDVFQEVSRILWQKFDTYQPGTQFTAWGRRIAYFRIVKHLERKRRGPALFGGAFFEAVESEMDSLEETLDQQFELLAECLKKLSRDDRRLIEMRYQPGSSPRHMANELGQPVKSIYRTLSRIRRLLLDCVSRSPDKGTDG